MKKDLVLFIKHARELEISIGTNEIIIEAYRLMPALKELSYKSIHNWCDRFLMRHGYTLRKVTHIGQPVRDDASDMIIKFILDIKQKMIDYDINDNYQLIANMDETRVWFEMFRNETIERIGAKEVKIKSFGCDKNRISLILTILANGEKLKPVIIFKGKTDNRLEKKLQNNIHVKNNEILVKCQDNAWFNNEIFQFWLNKVWFPYCNNQKNKFILVMDRATSHYSDCLTKNFINNNSTYILIPPGLTRFLQPLDVSINFPFKNYLKQEYINFNLFKSNKEKAMYDDIINFVCNVWYSEGKIIRDIIKKSFKATGITEDFIQSKNKRIFKWPNSIIPEVDMKEHIGNLKKINIEKNYDVILDDSDNKEKEKDIKQLCITDYFVNIKK